MTGMKEGAGEDPFAEDTEETAEQEADPDPPSPTEDQGRTDPEETGRARTTTRSQQRQTQSMQIPYKYRRDGVQDGRDRVPLFLKPDTKRSERTAQREMEDRFDESVSLTDLREALVKAGLDNLDQVEGHLGEWGYGMTFGD